MGKTWCSNCGNCISFADNSKKPNFCNNCGESLGGIKKPIQNDNTSIDDIDEEDSPLPSRKISIEVEGLNCEGKTFGELYKRKETNNPRVRKLGSRTSLKVIKQKFRSKEPVDI